MTILHQLTLTQALGSRCHPGPGGHCSLCGTGAQDLAEIQILWQRVMTVFYNLWSIGSGR